MGRLALNHLRLLNAPLVFRDGLLPPVEQMGENTLLSLSMKWEGTRIAHGDIVDFDGGRPCVVECCLDVGGEFFLLADRCVNPRIVTPAATRWTISHELLRVGLSGRSPRLHTYSVESDSERVVVRFR